MYRRPLLSRLWPPAPAPVRMLTAAGGATMEQPTQVVEHTDAETLAKIGEAQTLNGRPRTDYMVAYAHIGELLEKRAAEIPDRVYLVYCEEEPQLRQEFTYSQFNSRVNRIAGFVARD